MLNPNLYKETTEQAQNIENFLATQKKAVRVTDVIVGPTVTTFFLELTAGVRQSDILKTKEDIERTLGVRNIRFTTHPDYFEVLVEVPRQDREYPVLTKVLSASEFKNKAQGCTLPALLGNNSFGELSVVDLDTQPHMLISGTTKSGKSTAINSIILGLMQILPPEDVKFVMVDMKMNDLVPYNDSPYLLQPVATEQEEVCCVLEWVFKEMVRRQRLFRENKALNIEDYNKRIGKLSRIVLVLDEFASVMRIPKPGKDDAYQFPQDIMTNMNEKARSVGIHIIAGLQLVLAEILPSKIQGNFPARLSFKLLKPDESLRAIGEKGAESLMLKGDGLYKDPSGEFIRIQAPNISREELISHLEQQRHSNDKAV